MDAPWRPTQRPLNREEQKKALQALQEQYWPTATPVPEFPMQAVKESKLPENQQLQALQAQLQERGMAVQANTVQTELEEMKLTATVKQFYCNHRFQKVDSQWGILKLRYKLCTSCGLVKD